MKQLLILFILPLFLSAQAVKTSVSDSEWLTDYDSAIKVAKKKNRNVLVYFTGSDWCPPCKMLKKDLFESAEFLALSDKYVLLYIDMPRNKDILSEKQLLHNKKIWAKLNTKGAVPLMKILNKSGKALDEYGGYSMNGETSYHLNLLKKYK